MGTSQVAACSLLKSTDCFNSVVKRPLKVLGCC